MDYEKAWHELNAWLDKTYRASGRGKNELVERALVQILPSKLMPQELKDILPSDYFDKLN